MQWAVSQAVWLRRMHVRGDLVCTRIVAGQAAAGCRIRLWTGMSTPGASSSGSRATAIGRAGRARTGTWCLSAWCTRPEGAWPSPPYTKVAQTPVVREKPFLQVNAAGEFSVRVPELHSDSVGITWRGGETAGETIPIARFYIARPDVDTAETINAQLARGKDLISDAGDL